MTQLYPRALTESKSAALNVASFMAELGKRVIHPGGRPSTVIRDEGLNALRLLGRALSSPARPKRMRTVLGRMRIIQPWFTAFVLRGTKPATAATTAA